SVEEIQDSDSGDEIQVPVDGHPMILGPALPRGFFGRPMILGPAMPRGRPMILGP
ncbi:hypothetical protein A2U01_0084257, partial [Trifolium medium]|nr:hypothetical protein [Trifolium medium]